MNQKNSLSSAQFKSSLVKLTAFSLISITQISAQTPAKITSSEKGSTMQYVLIIALAFTVAVAVWRFLKSKREKREAATKAKSAKRSNALDVAKEMEWLRKNQRLVGKKEKPIMSKSKNSAVSKSLAANPERATPKFESFANAADDQEAGKNCLPIFLIKRLEPIVSFDDLPIAGDSALMDAIEQTHDELEEDSEVRELAVRILAAFKTRNSVEALTQVALYDLLANLRSKAVTVLGEFDHETVFEPILLACADPTREVRAAAARSLTKLTFDRADAWTRIAELNEEGRIVAAARAAIESGFVEMSFDRLIHQDRKYAYEAFALMALLINAGETEKIFNALENHRNTKVRKAVLHTIKVIKNPKALEGLYNLLEKGNLAAGVQEEIDKTIEEISGVTV